MNENDPDKDESEWMHVAITWSATDSNLKQFVNGVALPNLPRFIPASIRTRLEWAVWRWRSWRLERNNREDIGVAIQQLHPIAFWPLNDTRDKTDNLADTD